MNRDIKDLNVKLEKLFPESLAQFLFEYWGPQISSEEAKNEFLRQICTIIRSFKSEDEENGIKCLEIDEDPKIPIENYIVRLKEFFINLFIILNHEIVSVWGKYDIGKDKINDENNKSSNMADLSNGLDLITEHYPNSEKTTFLNDFIFDRHRLATALLFFLGLIFARYLTNSKFIPKMFPINMRNLSLLIEPTSLENPISEKKLLVELYEKILKPIFWSTYEKICIAFINDSIFEYFMICMSAVNENKSQIENCMVSSEICNEKLCKIPTEFSVKILVILFLNSNIAAQKTYFANKIFTEIFHNNDGIRILIDIFSSYDFPILKTPEFLSNLCLYAITKLKPVIDYKTNIINNLFEILYDVHDLLKVKLILLTLSNLMKIFPAEICNILSRFFNRICKITHFDPNLIKFKLIFKESDTKSLKLHEESIDLKLLAKDFIFIKHITDNSKLGIYLTNFVGPFCEIYSQLTEENDSELISSCKDILNMIFAHKDYSRMNITIQQIVYALFRHFISFYEIQKNLLIQYQQHNSNLNIEENNIVIIESKYSNDKVKFNINHIENYIQTSYHVLIGSFSDNIISQVEMQNLKIISLLVGLRNHKIVRTLGKKISAELMRILYDFKMFGNSHILNNKNFAIDCLDLKNKLKKEDLQVENYIKSYNKGIEKILLSAIDNLIETFNFNFFEDNEDILEICNDLFENYNKCFDDEKIPKMLCKMIKITNENVAVICAYNRYRYFKLAKSFEKWANIPENNKFDAEFKKLIEQVKEILVKNSKSEFVSKTIDEKTKILAQLNSEIVKNDKIIENLQRLEICIRKYNNKILSEDDILNIWNLVISIKSYKNCAEINYYKISCIIELLKKYPDQISNEILVLPLIDKENIEFYEKLYENVIFLIPNVQCENLLLKLVKNKLLKISRKLLTRNDFTEFNIWNLNTILILLGKCAENNDFKNRLLILQILDLLKFKNKGKIDEKINKVLLKINDENIKKNAYFEFLLNKITH